MINVAVDGPAGAGKSSVARIVAKTLGYIYVDTGALYRAVGLHVLRNGKSPKKAEDIVPLLVDLKIDIRFTDAGQRVFIGEEDVSDLIRSPEASMAASDVSAHPEVRAFLFSLQREVAAANNCIMDGRDIGTVVLPNAQVKVFLTASVEARAKRRFIELEQKGSEVTLEEVAKDIEVRDYQDTHRAIAPLKAAEDSVLLDTSDLSFDESVDALIKIIKEKI